MLAAGRLSCCDKVQGLYVGLVYCVTEYSYLNSETDRQRETDGQTHTKGIVELAFAHL